MTTHDSIVYSEKTRRIRAIYPYVRYGLILGGVLHIPPRTLRLGTEFDFIIALPERLNSSALDRIAKLLSLELRLSANDRRFAGTGENCCVTSKFEVPEIGIVGH